MAKTALVLGGGGAKGSYQIGVWRALRELGKSFDIITGTSIGAINGALMAQGDFEAAEKLWDTIEYEKLFEDERKGELRGINSALDMVKFAVNDAVMEGCADNGPLEKLIISAVNEQKVRLSGITLGIVAVELPVMRPHTLTIRDIPEGELWRWLMASSACFPVFSPYRIDGVRYIDGGYYDNVPTGFAAALGADSITAVDLDGVGFVRPLHHAEGVKLTRISSHWDLGAIFDFDKSVFARNKRLGYNETLKAFGIKEGFRYTFPVGAAKKRFSGGEADALAREISMQLGSASARTVTMLGRDEETEYLSRLDIHTQRDELLCRAAETAGAVYGLSPEEEYSFGQFDSAIVDRYRREQQRLTEAEGLFASKDIKRVMAAVLELKSESRMTAALARLCRREEYREATKLLSHLLPREYTAAVYTASILGERQDCLSGI